MRNLEDLLAQVGNAHRFQLIMVFFVKIPDALVAWTMTEMAFVKAEPKWCCVPKDVNETAMEYCHNGNQTFGKECPHHDDICSQRVFENGMDTIVNEWDLVCDSKWKANLSISVQMAGVLVGALITGHLCDLLGRKKTFYFSVATLMTFSLVTGLSTSWEMFMVFRILLGLSCGIYLVVCMPYMMEFLSPSKRDLPAAVPVFSCGVIAMTFAAWQVQDWRWVHWICAALLLPFLLSWFFIPESLRWLTVRGRLDEAEKVLAYVARVNRKCVPEGCRDVLEAVYAQERQAKEGGKQSYSYVDIYRGWNLFKISVILQVLWFLFSLCGYGIPFGASTLGLNLFLNLFLLAGVGIPFLAVLHTIMARIGRKTLCILLLSMSSASAFASVVIYEIVSDEWQKRIITNILCLIANTCLGCSWVAVMVINNELYPTVLRSLGYGAANTMSRVGGVLAPFAFDFSTRPIQTYALIGGSMAVCAFLTIFLDETKGVAMQDTMQEAKFAIETAHIKKVQTKRDSFVNGSNKVQEQRIFNVAGHVKITNNFENKETSEHNAHRNRGFHDDTRL